LPGGMKISTCLHANYIKQTAATTTTATTAKTTTMTMGTANKTQITCCILLGCKRKLYGDFSYIYFRRKTSRLSVQTICHTPSPTRNTLHTFKACVFVFRFSFSTFRFRFDSFSSPQPRHVNKLI